jgi:PAS domain S-box-containing protein
MVDVEILVVDDRPEDLLAIESILTSNDYRLVTARTGGDALRRLLERDFAVILIDVKMPVMDGFELAALIKERERSRYTPIVFLTSGGPDIIHRSYAAGAVDYMTKPLDPEVLRAKVAIFVQLYRKDVRIREQAEALRAAERRERELELAAFRTASEARYRNLAEAIPNVVWTADGAGEITYFSRRWYEYTGQTFERAKGRGWMTAIAPADSERSVKRWFDGLASESVFELECRLRRRDGELGWHLCRAVPERDSDGKLVGWLGTFTDCDVLKRAFFEAQKAVIARDEFLSIASHELRTPLTTLQLRLKSLYDALADRVEPPTRRMLDSSLRQGSRLMGLLDNLLDVSRIATSGLVLEREQFDLVEVGRELVEQFAEAAANSGVMLELRSDGPVVGSWDRMRVTQILRNLVSNAIKFAPKAPVMITILRRDSIAVVSVRDRGPGITADDLDRIFGPFERTEASRNLGGLGLGLFIARENALAHGGNIHVNSDHEGATFVVELPLDVAEQSTAVHAEQAISSG